MAMPLIMTDTIPRADEGPAKSHAAFQIEWARCSEGVVGYKAERS